MIGGRGGRSGTPLPVGPNWGLGHGGRGPVAPPTAGMTPQVSSLSEQIYLPEVFPIPTAVEFNPLGSAGTAAAGTVNIPFTGLPGGILSIPSGTYGVLRSITFYITDMLTTTAMTFTVFINTVPVQGYTQVPIFPRNAPFVSNGFDCMVRFSGPADITVSATEGDAGTYVVGASLGGWFWGQAADAQWRTFGK